MRVRMVILLSLGLNVLLGTRLYLAYRYPQPTGAPAPARSLRVAPTTNQAKPRVVVRRQFFAWNEIESDDYPTYIANLRSIGCPESTIRDIIVADINQLYAQKRASEVVTGDQQWWRSEPDPELLQAAADKSKALDEERRALLTKLLGPGWEVSGHVESSPPSGIPLNGPILGQLPAAVKQTVRGISARSQQQQQAYILAQQQAGQPVDPAQLARLRQQTRDELGRVLSPTQLEEFLLRYSSTADRLRGELDGFNTTPDEFRNLFRVRDPIDQQIQLYYSGSDAASVRQRQQLEKQREEGVKQAIGQERYQLYQLLHDPLYRQTQAAAEQLGAPPDTLMPLYQINQLTAAEQQRIKNDPTLTAEERDTALQQVQQEQQKSIRQLLAAKAPPGSRTQPGSQPPMPPLPEDMPPP